MTYVTTRTSLVRYDMTTKQMVNLYNQNKQVQGIAIIGDRLWFEFGDHLESIPKNGGEAVNVATIGLDCGIIDSMYFAKDDIGGK